MADDVANDPHVPAIQAPDIEADDYAADSAYDSEVNSYTTSLASSAVDYKFMNGRRYHAYKEGAYIYPNDEDESDRLDVVHKMIDLAMGNKLHWAPVKEPKRILDIGTGTGIWAMEIAEEFPNADVLGNDLSPIQPRWVPPNVHFEVDDVEQPWTFSQQFDYIHSRCLGNAVKDWPKLVGQAFESLKPGKYAEFVDFDVTYISPDGSLAEGSDLYNLNRQFITTTRAAGIESCPGPLLEGWMKDAGFTEVLASRRFLPLGTWPADKNLKEVGAWNLMMVNNFLEALLNFLYSQMLGYSKEEREVLYAKIRKEIRDPKVHSMYSLWIVYGKKPEDSSAAADDEQPAAPAAATTTTTT